MGLDFTLKLVLVAWAVSLVGALGVADYYKQRFKRAWREWHVYMDGVEKERQELRRLKAAVSGLPLKLVEISQYMGITVLDVERACVIKRADRVKP